MTEKLEVLIHLGHAIGEDQNADPQHQHAADDFQGSEMSLEPRIERQKLIQSQAGQKERHAEAKRIDAKQEHAFRHSVLLTGESKNGGEDWAKTRRPSQGEHQAENQRSKKSALGLHVVHSLILVQRIDPENARRVIMPAAGSASEEAKALLGPDVKVVCALQNVSAHVLRDLNSPIDCDVLVCGDKEARPIVMQLVNKLGGGVKAVEVGPIEAARLIEPITALLIRLNILNKVYSAGIRITGLPSK